MGMVKMNSFSLLTVVTDLIKTPNNVEQLISAVRELDLLLAS